MMLLTAQIGRRIAYVNRALIQSFRAVPSIIVPITDQVAEHLLDRLDVMAQDTLSLLKEVGLLAEQHVKAHGITGESITLMGAEILAQRHDIVFHK